MENIVGGGASFGQRVEDSYSKSKSVRLTIVQVFIRSKAGKYLLACEYSIG